MKSWHWWWCLLLFLFLFLLPYFTCDVVVHWVLRDDGSNVRSRHTYSSGGIMEVDLKFISTIEKLPCCQGLCIILKFVSQLSLTNQGLLCQMISGLMNLLPDGALYLLLSFELYCVTVWSFDFHQGPAGSFSLPQWVVELSLECLISLLAMICKILFSASSSCFSRAVSKCLLRCFRL